MDTHNKFKQRIIVSFILIFTINSFLLVIPLISNNSEINNSDEIDIIQQDLIFPAMSAGIGEDAWWNASYQWRQCINITNPGGYNLTDNFISIEFDYTTLRDNYDMDPDLYDVRIIENNNVRNYYVKKDFPSVNSATIWFETNSTSGASEYDTYMYWGNASINYRGNNHVNYDPSGTSWWSFEEGSGTQGSTTIDKLNNANATLWGRTGSDYPDYDTDSAVGSYSLKFDGANDFVYVNDEMHFEDPNEITALTVSCWFKTDFSSTQDYTYNWAFLDFDRSEYFNFYIDCDSDFGGGTAEGRIGFSSSASGSSINDFYGSVTGLNDNEWHFASIVYDGTNKYIYVDDNAADVWGDAHEGAALGTGTDRWGFSGDGSEASSENGGRNSRYYNGYIDEIRYFEYGVAPDEIQWLANYYTIESNLLPVTERAATVTIIVKDVGGRRVPGAEVSLWENSTDILVVDDITYTQNTLSDGTVAFSKVPFGGYNITVNYTLNSGLYEAVVYNSSNEVDGEVVYSGLIVSTIVYANLWTIDFEVDDWDGDPLNYGFVQVNDSVDILENLNLDSEGKATFRWLNVSSYNYKIYYNNTDYVIENPTLLNYSTIIHENIKTSYLVNETNINSPGAQNYSVNIDRFAPGSSYANPGNITLIDASVNMEKMDNLTQVRIWYLDATGHTFKEIKSYSGLAPNETFMYHPEEEEIYDVYGLRIEIEGDNSTMCNGTIDISLSYAYDHFVTVNVSKLSIRVIDDSETVPMEAITVRVEINGTGEHVTSLRTDDNGTAYGLVNENLGFWYKTNQIYNISLWIVNEQFSFRVNSSDQFFYASGGLSLLDYYNYTLNSGSSLVFELDLNFQNRISRFQNRSIISNTTVWGQDMDFSINYSYSDLGLPGPWVADDGIGSTVTLTVRSIGIGNPIVYENPMGLIGDGNYTITINSSLFSAGNYGITYLFSISGSKSKYNKPDDEIFVVFITPMMTDISLHNYSSMPDELLTNEFTQYFNEVINLTFKYYDFNTDSSLIAETFSYNWDYGSGSVSPDPLNQGYYTIEIDTSLVTNVGKYLIELTAGRENYSKIDNYGFFLTILSRPTKLNNETDVLFISESVYALEALNFSFTFTDVLTSTPISSLDDKSYSLQKRDELGNPIAGKSSTGNLIELVNNSFVLDLNTETMEVGDYIVFVTFNKFNYESKMGTIDLTIQERPTTLNGFDPFTPTAFQIDLGVSLNFTFSYVDTLTSTSITNLDNQSYSYTSTVPNDLSGNGTLAYDSVNEVYYLLGFDTIIKPNGTYTITATFEKENYSSQMTQISLIIEYVIADYYSYLTLISQNPSNFTTDIYWRDFVTITFNFTTQYQNDTIEQANATHIRLQFLDDELTQVGDLIDLKSFITGTGIYNYSFNTSLFSFIGGKTYTMNIYAAKTSPQPYSLPAPYPLQVPFKVQSLSTSFTAHNYTTSLEFPSYTLSEYWNQTFGITLYYSELINSEAITNANITYNWFYGSGQILPDVSKGSGFYSFNFTTGDAPEVGAYTITFQAVKQNFTKGVLASDFIINVINRPTKLGTSENVLYLSQKLYLRDQYNFTFEFTDIITSELLENADEKSFILQELDTDGDPIPGTTVTGSLLETVDHLYVLDLDTETLQDGEYSIVVTLNKDNYDFRVSIISLTIYKRDFYWPPSTANLVKVASGGTLRFQLDLTDPNNSSVPIIGADVYIMFRGTRYDFTDNGDGTYSLSLQAIPDAFFMSTTIVGTVNIEKTDYTTKVLDITVVVNMAEIFPGMPTFYFLMIIGSVLAIVGSLVTYRIIQQSRIPTFVKKARKMRKDIKGKKSIAETLLYPSKDEYVVKQLGDKWDMLGLSLQKVMGIEAKKKKKLSIDDTKVEDKAQKIVKKKEKKPKKEKVPEEKFPEEKVTEEEIPKDESKEEKGES